MNADVDALSRRHLRIGYGGLAVFLTLGAVLEALHGFKIGFYLDAGNETRRLMWRLAHAHGSLLSIAHVVYALTVRAVPGAARPVASKGLTAALILVAGGFFVGGITIAGGDPNPGVLLVPAGFVALLVSVVATARAVR
ncbi:MAG TPA: hypothetical protein VKU41_05045 [Polyangiaceae bacterium]|nr:hypothetical protein [Polyangiaceae bacterium]